MSKENKSSSGINSNLNKVGQKVELELEQEDLLKDLKESLKSTIDETSLIFGSLIEALDSPLSDDETKRETKVIVNNLISDYNKIIQNTSEKIENLHEIKYQQLEEE